MKPVRFAILGLAVSLGAIDAHAQAKPELRPIATVTGPLFDFAVMPNGRLMYLWFGDSLVVRDLSTRRQVLVARGEFDDFSVSNQGDRLVFDRETEDGSTRHIWTMPINSETGAALGPAQRVSTIEGHEPRVSPDGRLIAFVSPVDSSPTVVVVPVTGGPERVIGTFVPEVTHVEWTADGRYVLAHVQSSGTRGASIQRVPVDGGAPTPMFAWPAAEGSRGTWDGEFTLLRVGNARPNTRSYRGPNGEEGEFDLPAGSWARIDPVMGKLRRYLFDEAQLNNVRLIDLRTGTTSALAPRTPGGTDFGAHSLPFSYSPDGKRLALITQEKGKLGLSIVEASNGSIRTFEPSPALAPNGMLMQWTPDGTGVLYQTAGWRALVLLDVSTGRTRTVVTSPTIIGAYKFLQDGTLRFWQTDTTRISTIFETKLDGAPRRLREFPRDFNARGMFATPDLLEFATPSGEFIMDARAGAPTRLPVDSRPLSGGPSSSGTWWMFLLSADPGRRARLQVVNAAGDTSRILEVPFEILRTPIPKAAFALDNRSLFIVGRSPGQTAWKLFLVPVDGSAPREVATLTSTGTVSHFALAPDGRSGVYTVQSEPVITISEIDLSPLRRPGSRR